MKADPLPEVLFLTSAIEASHSCHSPVVGVSPHVSSFLSSSAPSTSNLLLSCPTSTLTHSDDLPVALNVLGKNTGNAVSMSITSSPGVNSDDDDDESSSGDEADNEMSEGVELETGQVCFSKSLLCKCICCGNSDN